METTNKNAPIVSDTTEAPHSQFSVNPIVPAPTECVNLAQNFLDRDNALLERGFSVIPIAPRDKKPVPGLGANSRTQNLDVVAAWANMWPDANAGVCADDNITILESDDAARFRKILSEMGVALPVTLTGGASPNRPHWFYKRTPACGESCVTVPGLFEFRNVNQYVVGPGSIHPNGSDYRFWNDAPIVELPDAVINALRQLADEYTARAKARTSTFSRERIRS
jgi:hypothetical protein